MANNYLNHLLISAPVDLDFEIYVLKTALNLVLGLRKNKFATTMEEDAEMLKGKLGWRMYLAVSHRLAQKEILRA